MVGGYGSNGDLRAIASLNTRLESTNQDEEFAMRC